MRRKVDYDAIWLEKFNLVKEFKEEYGRFPYQKEEYKGVKLGIWLVNQKCRLTNRSVRMEMLKSIGFYFGSLYDKSWDTYIKLLKEFKEEYDRFPYPKEEYKGVKLGAWLRNQKTRLDNGPRKEMLKSIGFDFGSLHDKSWDEHIKLLKEFKEEYDRFPYNDEIYHGVAIGAWVGSVRYSYNNQDSDKISIRLDENRIKQLMEMDFKFTDWELKFKLIKDFKEEYGRLPHNKEEYKGAKIGIWLMNHKKYDRNNPERRELLESIGVKFKEVK